MYQPSALPLTLMIRICPWLGLWFLFRGSWYLGSLPPRLWLVHLGPLAPGYWLLGIGCHIFGFECPCRDDELSDSMG